MPVFPPDNLMQDPCGAIKAGDTVRSLAKGYVANTGCVFDYKLLLEKQRKWKAEQQGLFKDVK
jgi:hypothetical protein